MNHNVFALKEGKDLILMQVDYIRLIQLVN